MFFVFELANWAFWWSLFQLQLLTVKVLLAIVPLSVIKAAVVQEFEKVGVKTTFDSKEYGKYDKTKYACEILVHNDQFFRKVAFGDSLGFGEPYMDGWYDCDDISECVNATLKIPVKLPQLLANRVALATNLQLMGKLSLRVAEEHYNLGNDLYSSMLDKTMN